MNLAAISERIANCAKQCGRDPSSVTLIAVTKNQSITTLHAAYAAGQRAFAENYLQEALPKIAALPNCEWHFIGPIQRNKTRKISEHFAWVQSVDSLMVAKRLNEQRPSHLPALNICLEVNINAEQSKSGVNPEQLLELAESVATLPRLRLRGLMAIPVHTTNMKLAHANFQRLASLQQQLIMKGFALDTLSMGMSHDFEAAIMEGATMVRIGQAIFGQR